jgi:hypothetical protein
MGDDIFIALRYIQNFIAGNGMVYNIGEQVEGYTDFLWLMLLSPFLKFESDPIIITQLLGILSSVGTLIICSVIGYKLTRIKSTFIIPFITLALALNYDYNVWATSGLETSFYSLLLCLAFYFYFFSTLNNYGRWLLSGFFLSLALMTRPDAMLIVGGCNGMILFYQLFYRRSMRYILSVLFFFNLAFLLIYVPYFAWRFNYYGFIFPNTYYDKLGYESLFSKGFYYLWLYFKPHFTSFLIFFLPPVVLLPLIKGKPVEQLRTYLSDRYQAAYLTCILVVYAYLILFIAKVGGDFMHARFIIPIVPFIYFIILYSLLQLLPSVKKLNGALLFIVLCSFAETAIRLQLFKIRDEQGNVITIFKRDVADERWFYTDCKPIETQRDLGETLAQVFSGINAKLVIRGGQACLGYFSNFSYVQEYHGLTDTLIAHSNIESRGRIGHEKHATYEYLQAKGIHFLFDFPPFSEDTYKYAEMQIPFHTVRVEIITYDNNVMELLKARLGQGFIFTDFKAYLDNYIQVKLPVVSKEELKKDYSDFYSYYFSHNTDKIRENKFLDALNN